MIKFKPDKITWNNDECYATYPLVIFMLLLVAAVVKFGMDAVFLILTLGMVGMVFGFVKFERKGGK